MLSTRQSLIAAALLVAVPLPAQVFTRILGSGDPVPGGVFAVGGFIEAPAYANGTLAFTEVHATGAGVLQVLFKHDSAGGFQRVVASGEPMPSLGRNFTSFTRLAVDADGSVAFLGSGSGSPSAYGIFGDAGGVLARYVDPNMQIPGGGSARFTVLANISLRADAGFVVFSGGGNNGRNNLSGVFAFETATRRVRTLALEGMTSPSGGTFIGTSDCDVRDGRVAFTGLHSGSSGILRGIYAVPADGSGPVVKIVDTSDIDPRTGQPFSMVGFGSIDEVDVAYFGWSNGPSQGIYATYLPNVAVPPGVQLPGIGAAGSLEDFHLDGQRIVFEATDGGPMNTPLGLFMSACGQVTKVLAPGDILDGKRVLRITHGDEALDGDVLAILVDFDDGTSAIYLVDLSSFDHYGQGLAGTGGVVPRVEGSGCPVVGTTFRIELRDGPPGMLGGITLGLAPASIPLLGGTLLVRPDMVASISLQAPVPGLPRPWASLPFALPNDPNLVGANVLMQVAYPDPGAVQGLSLSDALRITIE